MSSRNERQPKDNFRPLITGVSLEPMSKSGLHFLTLTKDQALAVGAKHAGTEHMLLAVLQEPNAKTALTTLIPDIEKVKAAIQSLDTAEKQSSDIIGKGKVKPGQIALSAQGMEVIGRAFREAGKITKTTRINSIHFLSALILVEGNAAHILKELGVTKKDLPKLRKMAKKLGDEIPEESVLDKGSIN